MVLVLVVVVVVLMAGMPNATTHPTRWHTCGVHVRGQLMVVVETIFTGPGLMKLSREGISSGLTGLTIFDTVDMVW